MGCNTACDDWVNEAFSLVFGTPPYIFYMALSFTSILNHHALWLNVFAERRVLQVVAKGSRSADIQAFLRLDPAWRTRDAEDGHHDTVAKLRDAQGAAGLGVQDGDQIGHSRDICLRATVGKVFRVDILVLEWDAENASRGNGWRDRDVAGVFFFAALNLLDDELPIGMAFEESPLDSDDLAPEQDFGRVRASALLDHLLRNGADGVGGMSSRDGPANPPRQRNGVEDRVVLDGMLVRGFGGHSHARTHFGTRGSQCSIHDLVVRGFCHQNRLSIARGNRTGDEGSLLKGRERCLPVCRISTA